jgi:hypothetical protein
VRREAPSPLPAARARRRQPGRSPRRARSGACALGSCSAGSSGSCTVGPESPAKLHVDGGTGDLCENLAERVDDDERLRVSADETLDLLYILGLECPADRHVEHPPPRIGADAERLGPFGGLVERRFEIEEHGVPTALGQRRGGVKSQPGFPAPRLPVERRDGRRVKKHRPIAAGQPDGTRVDIEPLDIGEQRGPPDGPVD